MTPVDESSPTLSHPKVPLDAAVSPTDIVGAVAGYVVAMLSLGGMPELLHLTPNQVGMFMGVTMLTAGTVRHIARLWLARKASL